MPKPGPRTISRYSEVRAAAVHEPTAGRACQRRRRVALHPGRAPARRDGGSADTRADVRYALTQASGVGFLASGFRRRWTEAGQPVSTFSQEPPPASRVRLTQVLGRSWQIHRNSKRLPKSSGDCSNLLRFPATT